MRFVTISYEEQATANRDEVRKKYRRGGSSSSSETAACTYYVADYRSASLPPSVPPCPSCHLCLGNQGSVTVSHRAKKRKKGLARRPLRPSTRPQPQLLHASNSTSSSSVLRAAGLCWLMQGRIKLSWSRLSPVLRCNADLSS